MLFDQREVLLRIEVLHHDDRAAKPVHGAAEPQGRSVVEGSGGEVHGRLVRTEQQRAEARHPVGTLAEGRAGDVRDSQADISKAKRLLGYAPAVSFEEGLAKTIEWYRSRKG